MEIPKNATADKVAIEKAVIVDILTIADAEWFKIDTVLGEFNGEDGSSLHDGIWLTPEGIVVTMRYKIAQEGGASGVVKMYSNNTPVESLAVRIRDRIRRISALPESDL